MFCCSAGGYVGPYFGSFYGTGTRGYGVSGGGGYGRQCGCSGGAGSANTGGGGGAGAAAVAGPTNVQSSGAIAGTGGKGGEPGVDLRKRKRSDPRLPMGIGKRKDF